MRNAQIQVYKYNELNEKAKEKVLSYFREANDYPFLEEGLEDNLRDLLRKQKIEPMENLKVYYSLSNCQGDGVCFIGTFEWKNIKVVITHNDRYYHSNSVTIELFNYDGEFIYNPKLEASFKTIYKDVCRVLEKQGYEEIEYEDSEERIKEIIELNEYEFNEDGSIFKGLKE